MWTCARRWTCAGGANSDKKMWTSAGGPNSDTMALAALSHGLLTYTAHLQPMVFVLPPWSKPQGFPQVVEPEMRRTGDESSEEPEMRPHNFVVGVVVIHYFRTTGD
jgi:hypothetical protein